MSSSWSSCGRPPAAGLRGQGRRQGSSHGPPSTPTCWRRSWLLGWATTAITRIQAAEARAENAEADDTELALVLRDRVHAVRHHADQAYPHTRTTRETYTGTGR